MFYSCTRLSIIRHQYTSSNKLLKVGITTTEPVRLLGGYFVRFLKQDWTSRGWRSRSVEDYNKLPPSLRLDMKLPSFKKKLKEWTKKYNKI